MNDKVKFERRSGIWNVRFPDGKNRSYKNQDLAEQAINTFLAQNPKYTAVMGDVKSSTKSSSKSKTVQKAAQNEPQSQMLDEVVVTAKHLHPEKLDQEGTVVTESKFASEDPFVQDAVIRSDLKQSMREGQNWIDRQQGRNYNQNFENAYYSMGNDWFLHPQDYIYPGYFNSDFHKNYREGSDLAGQIIAGYAGSLYGLGKVFELPSTIGEIWQGAKGLYNAYKLNPLFGAYQTFKVAAPTAVGMAAGYGGYKGTDWVSRQLTGKTYGEKFSEGTGLPIWLGDLTNPGGYIPISYGVKLWNGAVNTAKNAKNLYYGFQHGDIYKISTNPLLKQILDSPITERFLTKTQPGKRALETIMRTTSAPNPIPETLQGMQKLPWKPRINYILFGKNPKLRRLFGQPNMHYGDNSWSSSTIIPYTIDGGEFGSIDAPITVGGNVYAGLVDNTGNIVIGKGYGDIIDAYLYGTTIDPKIATLSTNNAGRQFFDNYILRNYPNKNIKSYTVKGDVDPKTIMKTSKWEGRSDTFAEEFRTNDNKAAINVAGHNSQSGWTDPSSRFPQVQRGFDIWKFNPEEYHNKWDVGNNYLESRGLELVDKAGTPIIFEQPWKLIAQ